MKTFLTTLLLLSALAMRAGTVTPQYTKNDSARVVSLIAQAASQPEGTNLMVYVARQFLDLPYVAKTLENNDRERLVVNLRQLDCTTYVENVLAIVRCVKQGKTSFSDFCRCLQEIRYMDGDVSYAHRLHYFSLWIEENTKMKFVEEIRRPSPPFTAVQTLRINYMTTHADSYPMLVRDPEQTKEIAKMEQSINGRTYRFIPKETIANTALFRRTIHDGDIIAIVTRKSGLDTSHIGIAVWHEDGLHLLNASLVHKKVVEERRTLHDYMMRNRSQIGIRVVRVK